MAAYGAPLAYLIIIAVYAGVMNRADRRAERRGPLMPFFSGDTRRNSACGCGASMSCTQPVSRC